jgi:predicted RNase H-like HicB family nuclease
MTTPSVVEHANPRPAEEGAAMAPIDEHRGVARRQGTAEAASKSAPVRKRALGPHARHSPVTREALVEERVRRSLPLRKREYLHLRADRRHPVIARSVTPSMGRESYNPVMGFDDYKVVLYRQEDGSWVAEIPALGGCYALMDTREAALAELEQVFTMIAEEHRDRGQALPKDTTEVVHA